MASPLSGVGNSLFKLAEIKRQKQQSQYDDLIKQAQLKELGYNITAGEHGGYALTQEPGVISMKALQRQKLQNELDPNYEANQAAAKERALFGVRKEMFGNNVGASNDQFIMTPEGHFVRNPNKPSPMNELQQTMLEEKKKKYAEEEQAKLDQEENLKSQAEDTLSTIEEVKKGKKYFGPLGNAPSALVPSSLTPGGYGDRKNWEANINKLLSGKVIEVMGAMKKASKTGATGFGQLSNKELGLLQEASTALKRDLNPDDAMKYLAEIENIHKKVLGGGKRFGAMNQENGQTDSLEAEAQAAIDAGADPIAVKQRISQLRIQRG